MLFCFSSLPPPAWSGSGIRGCSPFRGGAPMRDRVGSQRQRLRDTAACVTKSQAPGEPCAGRLGQSVPCRRPNGVWLACKTAKPCTWLESWWNECGQADRQRYPTTLKRLAVAGAGEAKHRNGHEVMGKSIRITVPADLPDEGRNSTMPPSNENHGRHSKHPPTTVCRSVTAGSGE